MGDYFLFFLGFSLVSFLLFGLFWEGPPKLMEHIFGKASNHQLVLLFFLHRFLLLVFCYLSVFWYFFQMNMFFLCYTLFLFFVFLFFCFFGFCCCVFLCVFIVSFFLVSRVSYFPVFVVVQV